MRFLIAFLSVFLGLHIGFASKACTITSVGMPNSMSLTYDPFSAENATLSVSFQIKNDGGKACDAAIAFFDTNNATASNGNPRLGYAIAGSSEANLINNMPVVAIPTPSVKLLTMLQIAPRETRRLNAVVTIARGQIVAPQTDTRMVQIALYQGNGGYFSRKLQEMTAILTITVKRVMSLNIAGAGHETTLDMGILSKGEKRSVILQARSNQKFNLNASSQNSGKLKLEPVAMDGVAWEVPYTIRIENGAEIALLGTRKIQISKQATGLSGVSIPMEIEIGDPSKQRAGRYRDVITIIIDAEP